MPLVTKAADERLTNSISKWQNKTWFGMATEIAAHAPFGKEFISTKNKWRQALQDNVKFGTFYGTPCKQEHLKF